MRCGLCASTDRLKLTLHIPAYQAEIDNLTKRSKFAESALGHVFRVLAEVPDPYPLLEAAVVRDL